MKRIFYNALLFLIPGFSSAQALQPGDIAFLGIMTDNPDAFAFVALAEIQPLDSIIFTDNGWNGTDFFANEDEMVWQATELVPAGTVIILQAPPSGPDAIILQGTGITHDFLGGLSGTGEQLFAYVWNDTIPIPIAALSSSNWLAICNAVGTGNTNSSCLPSNLTNGTNAMSVFTGNNNTDNAFFNITSPAGTVQDLLALINDHDNWTSDNDTAGAGVNVWPDWAFLIGDFPDTLINFSSVSETITEGDGPLTISLSFSEPLTNALVFDLDVSSDVTVQSTDYTTDPAATSSVIQLVAPAGASSVSFTLSITDDADMESLEQITFRIAALNGFFASGESDSLTININDNDQQIILPQLFINEVMASNTSTIQDENGENDDWIEIYNAGDTDFDLVNLYITDNASNPGQYQFPFGAPQTMIPAGGFKIIWADQSPEEGALHTNFGLSAGGEFVGLYQETSGVKTVLLLIDSVTFGQLSADQSWGRQNDGEEPWINFSTATPGATNEGVGIYENDKLRVVAYPNPVTDRVYISLPSNQGDFNITVTDMNGRIVESLVASSSVYLPVNHLAEGIYLVDVNDGIKRALLRIEVTH